jgi:hypothetical protein
MHVHHVLMGAEPAMKTKDWWEFSGNKLVSKGMPAVTAPPQNGALHEDGYSEGFGRGDG